MSFGGSQWCRSTPDLEHRSTGTPKHRSTTPTESPASCNAVKILTHEEFAAKHPHPPSPDKVRIARRADTSIDRHRESSIDRHSEAAIDRQPPVPIDRRTPITYRVLMPKIDVARLNALRPKSKPSEYPPEPVRTPSNDGEDPMEEDRVPTIRTLRRRKEKVAKHLKRGANDKEKEFKTPQTISRRINDPGIIAACHCGEDYETDYSASIETHTATSIDSGHQISTDKRQEESVDSHPDDWENDYYNPAIAAHTRTTHAYRREESVDSRPDDWDSDYYNPIMVVNDAPAKTPDGLYVEERLNMQIRNETRQGDTIWGRTQTSHPIDRAIRPSIDTHYQQSIDNNNATSIDNRPIPNTTVSEKDKFDHQFLIPDEFGIFSLIPDEFGIFWDPDGYAKAIDGRTLHISREDIADILQTANGADNMFMHHRSNPEQKATKEFYDTAGGIDNSFIQKSHHPTQTSIDIAFPTSVDRQPEFGRRAYDIYDGNTIRLHNTDIRRVLERASRDEPSYICLPEHANLFTQTKLVPEIYTKDEINEMFYGLANYLHGGDEAKHSQNSARDWRCSTSIDRQKTTPSIDRHHHTSIDNPMPASINDSPPRPYTKKSQKDFHTKEEINQLVEEIYRALETTEERLDGRCNDIYFPMDISISALTSKIEAIQKELVEIQSYIARRPEASLSIDRRNNISTDIHHRTSVDDATNRGRLVPKMTSDMSDTHYHGEEISAATYATLRRHQLNLENLEEILQRMENTTVTMKEKWRREEEAIREFTDSTKDTKVDQPVNYPLLLRLF
ncbi:hypothetical protein DY000_02052552 [Brassica cretica]|uniref:Aminotransferase-like plant mobile domain-containing protein n=1 Tax=Brassica cretica TaxID=69181 RepID=A0ABQ7AB36_BRACR|nr:hypothetical protein DY000_02052552 [Brassica cretica]